MPAPLTQYAALPMRWKGERDLRVLLVTSRETGRWVVPKGWPKAHLTPWQTAEREALEEAGALGKVGSQELGNFLYAKRLADGASVDCRVHLFPMLVRDLRSNWKERSQRRRKWFKPADAAGLVHEPELRDILLRLQLQSKPE